VLGGSSPSSLHTVKTFLKRGFETTMTIPARTYVEVEALDWSGHVLGRSPATKP
jgi:hypothetical protein